MPESLISRDGSLVMRGDGSLLHTVNGEPCCCGGSTSPCCANGFPYAWNQATGPVRARMRASGSIAVTDVDPRTAQTLYSWAGAWEIDETINLTGPDRCFPVAPIGNLNTNRSQVIHQLPWPIGSSTPVSANATFHYGPSADNPGISNCVKHAGYPLPSPREYLAASLSVGTPTPSGHGAELRFQYDIRNRTFAWYAPQVRCVIAASGFFTGEELSNGWPLRFVFNGAVQTFQQFSWGQVGASMNVAHLSLELLDHSGCPAGRPGPSGIPIDMLPESALLRCRGCGEPP